MTPSPNSGQKNGNEDKIAARAPSARRLARLKAVQLLYQIEMTKAAPDQAMMMMIEPGESGGGKIDEKLFRHLVAASAVDPAGLDQLIADVLPVSWTLERLDSVLRALLRLAVLELKANPEIPPLVTISEYVALAHAFFGGKEPGFVHGVLNRLAHLIRAREMSQTGEIAEKSELD